MIGTLYRAWLADTYDACSECDTRQLIVIYGKTAAGDTKHPVRSTQFGVLNNRSTLHN
jgi:hypothetical protein